MGKLYIMIGLPGSGKDSVIKQHKNEGDVVLSSDEIRIELFGSEVQDKNGIVFDTMIKRCLSSLKNNKTVYYNATNLNAKRRMTLIKEAKRYTDDINAIFCVVPTKVIFERNKNREERHIPEDKIFQMFKTMDIPMYYEGYKDIYIINTDNKNNNKKTKSDILNLGVGYDQKSEYHNALLIDHLRLTAKMAFRYSHKINLYIAGRFHDIGKPYVREWNEEKNKYTYYEHNRVSAYLYLLYYSCKKKAYKIKKISNRALKISALIYHHMDRFIANLDKTEYLLGEKTYGDLVDLMRADAFRKEDKNERH